MIFVCPFCLNERQGRACCGEVRNVELDEDQAKAWRDGADLEDILARPDAVPNYQMPMEYWADKARAKRRRYLETGE